MRFPTELKKSKNMSSNIFNGKRFLLLFKQHFIHNTQLLLLSTVAYIGVIFIVLSLAQMENGFQPHKLESFQGFMMAFVAIFGILYVGHSFPAFRSKESTMSYLMVPASVPEKFAFEFLSRIGLSLLMLPLLYWATFHFQGYFFTIFTDYVFEPVGLQYLVKIEDMQEEDYRLAIYTVAGAAVMLALVIAFTGAAMFTKQPLVKSLFSVAVIVIFFLGYSYVVVEHLGVNEYYPPDNMWLVPRDELTALQYVAVALITANVVMLTVAYRKLKEREV